MDPHPEAYLDCELMSQIGVSRWIYLSSFLESLNDSEGMNKIQTSNVRDRKLIRKLILS